MKSLNTALLAALLMPCIAAAQNNSGLKQALTFHASFDKGLDADFSRGDKACLVRTSKGVAPAALNDELKLLPEAGVSAAVCISRRRATRARKAQPHRQQ